ALGRRQAYRGAGVYAWNGRGSVRPFPPGGLLPAPSLGAVGSGICVAGGALLQAVGTGRGPGGVAHSPGVAQLSPNCQSFRLERPRETDAPGGIDSCDHARLGVASPAVRCLLGPCRARGVALRRKSARPRVSDLRPAIQSRTRSPLLGPGPPVEVEWS